MRIKIIASIVSLGISGIALTADRRVPSQYSSIQAAIDASESGDRILLAPGLYRESVSVTRSVTIEPELAGPSGEVILTGTGVPGPAMYVGSGTFTGTLVLRGLTFDGQAVTEAGQFAGLFVGGLGAEGQLLIERCIFRDLRSGGTDGGAIWLGHPAVSIRECKFMRNRSTVHGAAIYAYDSATPLIERCVFIDHTFGTGTFYARIDANIQVRQCEVRNSNVLTAHHQTGVVTFHDSVGCQISALSNGGYVDGGGNNWSGPCPDCNGNGILDLDDMIFGAADCDENFVVDTCEVSAHPDLDRNTDGILDACQCVADANASNTVDAEDLAYILFAWGTDGGKTPEADITRDGTVDANDLSVVLGSWGPCP